MPDKTVGRGGIWVFIAQKNQLDLTSSNIQYFGMYQIGGFVPIDSLEFP
jgi:hypothetical protein